MVTNGTIYTTHSTPIKSKASSLTPGLCEHFHWINALKSSEVCFTSRRRFSTCAQSFVVYYIIRFFYLFSFYIIVFKTVFKFYSSWGIKKVKEKEIVRSFDRSYCSCFLDDAREKFYLHYPWYYLLIMKHQYANLIFVSDFIFYLVTFDLQASVDAEKNMLQDVNI